MVKKLALVVVISALLGLAVGCDKFGVTKSSDEQKKDNLIEKILENDQTAGVIQKQIKEMETENIRLNAVLAESEMTIKNLQGQLASAEASTINIQADIKSAKKTKTIIAVVAAISLIFNALFIWMLFGNKKCGKRLALPAAKDIDILKYSPSNPTSPTQTDKKTEDTDTIKKAQQASAKNISAVTADKKTKTVAKKTTTKKPAVNKADQTPKNNKES